jgi:hypothetical protein
MFVCPKCGGHTFRTLKDGSERYCTGKVVDSLAVPLVKDPLAKPPNGRPMTRSEKREAFIAEATATIPGSPAAMAAIAASQSSVIVHRHERPCMFSWFGARDFELGVTDEDVAAETRPPEALPHG